MDSSTSGKPKGATPNRPLTSRPSLSRNTKIGSPSPSSKVATESPRPATPKGVGLMSKPTGSRVGTTMKEANAAKFNTVRTTVASPNKPKPATHRDPASPIKPPAKYTTRPQNGEKGAQQAASPLVTKNEAAKKTAEGVQLTKSKPGQEAGTTTLSKQNGAAKREVGKVPEHGSVPKDKTLCLQPETSTSVPSKPLATAFSPTKNLKANPMSRQIVPPPEKPVNTTILSKKATNSPTSSTRPGAMTSTTMKTPRTASPLVKAPKATSVSTKETKIPTSPVKPLNTTSASTKPRSATLAKPPGNIMTPSNQVKVGKRLPATTKATPVAAKQVNTVPTAVKRVKASPVAHKSVKEESVEATPVVNEVSQTTPVEPLQVINSEVGYVEMNPTKNLAELEKTHEPLAVAEQIHVNNSIENTKLDDAKMYGKQLEDFKPSFEVHEFTSPVKELSAQINSQNKEIQLSSFIQEAKFPLKQATPLEEEHVSLSFKKEPLPESFIVSAKPESEVQEGRQKYFEEQLSAPSNYLQQDMKSPPQNTNLNMKATNSFGEPLQEQWRSPLEETHFSQKEKNNIEEPYIPKEHLQEEQMASLQETNLTIKATNYLGEPYISREQSQEQSRSSLEETNSTLKAKNLFENPNVLKEHLQSELRTLLKAAKPLIGPDHPLEEKIEIGEKLKEGGTSDDSVNELSEEVHVPIKKLDDKVASSIEPSKETLGLLVEKNKSLDEEQKAYMDVGSYVNQSEITQIKPLDDMFTAEQNESLEDVLTSSLEQVTPLEEGQILSEDDLLPVKQKGTMFKEEHRHSSKTLNQLGISPIELQNPSDILTSSTEELTPSEEEAELEKQTIQESMSPSEHLDMGKVTSKMNVAKPTELVHFSVEPVLYSKELFGGAEESKTFLEKEVPWNKTLQSSDKVVKHSEEGKVPEPVGETEESKKYLEKEMPWNKTLQYTDEIKLHFEEGKVPGPVGGTEELKTPLEKEMQWNKTLQYTDEVVKHSEEGKVPEPFGEKQSKLSWENQKPWNKTLQYTDEVKQHLEEGKVPGPFGETEESKKYLEKEMPWNKTLQYSDEVKQHSLDHLERQKSQKNIWRKKCHGIKHYNIQMK